MEQLRPIENIAPFTNPFMVESQITAPVNNSTEKTVNIDNLTEPSPKFKINLFESEISTDFLKTKTSDAKPEADNRNTTYINPGQPQINTNNFVTGQLVKSKDEFRSGVRAALVIVDYVVSLGAMKIAGDIHQTPYMPDAAQKKLVEDVVVEYLYKEQKQMPLWLTLMFAIVGSYGIIIVGAIKRRKEISKSKPKTDNKKGYSEQPISEMQKYADIKPPIIPPKTYPTNEQSFNVSRDGTAIPLSPTYSDVMEEPTMKSSPKQPDPNIIADTIPKLYDYISKGVYPLYRRSAAGKVTKVTYMENGTPKLAGKRAKIFRAKR